jgi:hypothetical protein
MSKWFKKPPICEAARVQKIAEQQEKKKKKLQITVRRKRANLLECKTSN